MNCRQVRTQLIQSNRPLRPGEEPADHLDRCAFCADYAARLAQAVRHLADHHAGVEPDASFAARVVAALPVQGSLFARFALRLLPAALALVLVLAGWVILEQRRPIVTPESAPTDDLLGWVLQDGENGS